MEIPEPPPPKFGKQAWQLHAEAVEARQVVPEIDPLLGTVPVLPGEDKATLRCPARAVLRADGSKGLVEQIKVKRAVDAEWRRRRLEAGHDIIIECEKRDGIVSLVCSTWSRPDEAVALIRGFKAGEKAAVKRVAKSRPRFDPQGQAVRALTAANKG